MAAGQDGDVAQHFLAAVTEAWGLDGESVERAPQLVDDESGQRLAVDVLGDDDEVLGDLAEPSPAPAGCPASLEIFLSVMRMKGSSSSASMRSVLVTK